MRISPIGWIAALLIMAAGCSPGDSLVPPDEVDPTPLIVTPVDMHTVQVRWAAVPGARTYELERRANLKGAFELILGNIPKSQSNYLDRDLDPATIYGYRLTAFNDLGQRLGVTPVAGGETAPEPGIEVTVNSVLGGDQAKSIDSSGYRVTVKSGPVSQALPIEVQGTQMFQPLPAGLYSVGLEDIASNCALEGVTPRVVTVTDQGLATIAKLAFAVHCRDKTRGRLVARVTATGDTTDANGFKAVLSGLADDATLPVSERAIVQSRDVGREGGQVVYENLRPGTYSLLLDNVAAFCTVEGARQRDGLRVEPLSDLNQEFKVDCSADGGSANRPFTFQTAWAPKAGATGSRAVLGVSLDLRQDPAADVRAFQFVIRTPVTVVRLDSVVPGTAGWSLTVNPNQGPGEFLALATRTTAAKGLVPFINAHYTIIGATGEKAPTRTIGLTIGAPDGSALDDRVRRVEDTLTVGNGPPPPPPTNEPPIAQANGPYSGTAGQAVNLTAAGSSDPDGSITAYEWDFGDGQTGTGSPVPHTYAAAGAYSARLIVTDNQGGKDTAQAAVTINAAGGGNGSTPFTWQSAFGTLTAATQTVPLNISLDLRPDISETPGQEQLQDWVVDSLKWNPAVLQFFAFNRTSGSGSVNFTQALSRGVLIFRGTVAPAQSSGLVSIASVVLKVIGAAGQQSPITTYLGAVNGPSTSGSFSYRSRIKIEDPTYTVAGGGPTTTTVAGRVTSSQQGNLAGVRVNLSGGGPTATTAANGTYTITGVAAGTYSVTLTSLPATCTAPAAQPVTVGSTPVAGFDFTVTCQAPQGTTTVSGTVTTPTGGAAGATVTLIPGNLNATTSAAGAYTIGGVAPGTYTASVSNVPAGCQNPATQSVTVAATPVTGVNFSLTCTAPPATGTVTGSITFASGSGTPALTAVVVTVTPTGGAALTTNPNASNQYTRTGVPVANGGGTVALTNLPAGCTGTTTVNYTGLTGGGTATAPAIQLTCTATPPASKYPFTLTWGAIAAGKVTMTVRIDMAAFNDPANNGAAADRIGAFQGTVNFPASRLSNASCSPGSGSGFSGVLNTASAGGVTAVLTNSVGALGLVTIFTCTFDVAGSGPTTPTWAAGSLLFGDQTGSDFGSKVDIVIDPLP